METAMHTMNPDTAIPRVETAPAETVSERRADVVSRGEFRLLLWMGAFALTAILGGMTVLYTGITDLRVAMEAQRADILDIVRSEIGGLRTEIGGEIRGLRAEIADLRERVARIETRLDGVETRLDGVETRLDSIETRLDTIIPSSAKSG